MYDKLVFKGYKTKNLNLAAERFREQTGMDPNAFVIRKEWENEVFGTKENTEKVLVSRFGGFACVYIPIHLTREQISELDNMKKVYESVQKVKETPEDEKLKQRMKAYTRYCNFCGQIYGTDPLNVVIHCGAPVCIEAHDEWLEYQAEIRRLRGKSIRKMGNNSEEPGEETGDEANELLDFSLDDPDNPTARGWIYLIQAPNGLYKIGRSDNIGHRFREIANQSPVRLWLTHTFFATNYMRAEYWLHQQFKNRRHHGEWFRLSEDEVDWIKHLEDYALDQA